MKIAQSITWRLCWSCSDTRNTFCGTWYAP